MTDNPVQLSFDPSLAPDVEIDLGKAKSDERWLRNASIAPMIHRVRESRGSGRFMTRCGLIGRVCAARTEPVECPDCWHS